VKAADERRVQKVEIARKPAAGAAVTGQHAAPEKAQPVLQSSATPEKVH
jgi:hypothetical protein